MVASIMNICKNTWLVRFLVYDKLNFLMKYIDFFPGFASISSNVVHHRHTYFVYVYVFSKLGSRVDEII